MSEKMTWDPHCYECKVRYRDPKAKDLVMYLHAWRYKVNSNVISQCTPGIFNLNQKFHGLSCLLGIDIHETNQNQSRETSVIRLQKFTTVNMVRKCHQWASFSIGNLFFEDYSIGSLMTDVFHD